MKWSLFGASMISCVVGTALAQPASPPAPVGSSETSLDAESPPVPLAPPPASTPVQSAPRPPVGATTTPPVSVATDDALARQGEPDEDPTRPTLRPLVEVFGQYAIRNFTSEGARPGWFHQIDVTRAFAGLEGRYRGAIARVVLESTRSANDGGLIGIAGNSLVMNLREAYAGYHLAPWNARYGTLEARLGIVPTLFVPLVEHAWRMRVLEKTTLERSGFFFPADLGAQVRYGLPKKLGALALSLENGEGYQRPELNRGKSSAVSLELHPLATVHEALVPLTLMAGYQDNSIGTDSTRADRVVVGALWLADEVHGGSTFVYALGADGDGSKTAYAVDAFVGVERWGPLLLGARISHTRRDTRIADDSVTQLLGSVGVRIVQPLEVYLAATRNWIGSGARSALPGEDYFEGRVAARVAFGP